MTVRVIPTLAAMAEVYRLPAEGGPESPRFGAYVELGRAGVPVSGYNPMTSKPVLPTIERLLAIDAEGVATVAAMATAQQLGWTEDLDLVLTLATPGMWTDRLATEVEHRLVGKGAREILVWSGEDTGEGAVASAAVAQVAREVWRERNGVPATVVAAAAQEGLALSMAGMRGARSAEAAFVLEVLGDDDTLSSMVAYLYGDRAAEAMGYTPVGLGDRAGESHAVALARE